MREFIIYIFTVVFSMLALFLSFFDFISSKFDDPIIGQILLIGVSLAIILIGDRLAATIKDKSLKNDILKELKTCPTLSMIKVFANCNDALDYITYRLSEATLVLNTKITSRKNVGNTDLHSEEVRQRYSKAIKTALKRKDFELKEVVDEQFSDYRAEMDNLYSSFLGVYEGKVTRTNISSFLNFTILEFEHDNYELIIGWIGSAKLNRNQPAFRICDQKATEYFRTYHSILMEEAETK